MTHAPPLCHDPDAFGQHRSQGERIRNARLRLRKPVLIGIGVLVVLVLVYGAVIVRRAWVRAFAPLAGWRVRAEFDLFSYSSVHTMGISPDGRLLATMIEPVVPYDHFDAQVAVWDLASGRRLAILQPLLGDGLERLAFSPDGRSLIAVSSTGAVFFWALPSMTLDRRIERPIPGGDLLDSVAISPDCRTIAFVNDGRVVLWNARTEQVTVVLEDEYQGWGPSTFSRDSRLLAVASASGLVTIWDVRSRSRRLAFCPKIPNFDLAL